MKIGIVKLGGSVITDKRRERTVRRAELARFAAEVAEAVARTRRRWLLGHGSGSFGHTAAARAGFGGDGSRISRRGAAATQRAAAELHAHVMEALLAAGVPAYSIAPSAAIVTVAGRPVSVAVEPVRRALEAGLVPVTYGDVVTDRERKLAICSTESALLAFARALRRGGAALRDAYWFGDTDGVYDDEGRTISRLAVRDIARLLRRVGGSAATDVTGGMRLRLETARAFARLGTRSQILDGRVPGAVVAALRGTGRGGTRVVP